MVFRLPTLPPDMDLPALFKRWWNGELKPAIERQEQRQDELLETQGAQLSTIEGLLRSVSYTTGLTISAAPDGATVTITVSDHLRVYVDKLVNVTGTVIEGQPYDTDLFIFYDDEARDGVPDFGYGASSDSVDAVPAFYWPFRHLVGAVHTPLNSAAPFETGSTSEPPGFPSSDFPFQ